MRKRRRARAIAWNLSEVALRWSSSTSTVFQWLNCQLEGGGFHIGRQNRQKGRQVMWANSGYTSDRFNRNDSPRNNHSLPRLADFPPSGYNRRMYRLIDRCTVCHVRTGRIRARRDARELRNGRGSPSNEPAHKVLNIEFLPHTLSPSLPPSLPR